MADVASKLDSWSTTIGSNSPSGTTVVGAGLDDNLRQIQAVVRELAATNSLASASTTDLSTIDETFITISGVTTITAFGTLTAGMYKWLTFSGILVLTYNATSLIIPGSANITTAVNDVALVKSLGAGNWQVMAYQKANGTAVVASTSTLGQCQLQYVSTISIKLLPWNGNLLTVNGANATVPDAGVSLANTGLTANTKYFIYAVATAGAISSLEASTTAYAVSTTAGNKGTVIKSADDTRTLVGMVYMNAGTPGLFGSSAIWQGVRSWFNDPGMAGNSGLAAAKTTSSATYVKLDSTTDITFLAWANELIRAWATGSAWNSSSSTNITTALGVDGTTPEDAQAYAETNSSTSLGFFSFAVATPARALTEGNHTLSLLGAASAATGNWKGAAAPSSSTPTTRCSFGVVSRGINP